MARREIVALGLSAGSFATQVRDLRICEHDWVALLWCLLCAGLEREGTTEEVRQMHSECGCAQANGASKTRRAIFSGAVVLALATVATVAIVGGEAVKTGQVRMELSDRNEFESQPAWYHAACTAASATAAAAAAFATCLFSFNTCFSSAVAALPLLLLGLQQQRQEKYGSWESTVADGYESLYALNADAQHHHLHDADAPSISIIGREARRCREACPDT